MKTYILLPLLLTIAAIFSCSEPVKTEQPKDVIINPIKQLGTALPQVDPYFTESSGDTSQYGPNSITRNVIQDKKGDYWFATWNGIIHYDGDIFTNYTNKEGLRRFRVFSILEDKSGDIWFGTIGAGIYRYNGTTFTNITTKDGLINDSIGCLMEDQAGNIWIGTQGGISRYDGSSFTNYTTTEGLLNDDINSIVEDQNGKLWIGSRGNVCYYDGTTFNGLTNPEGISFGNTRTIIEDKEGNIWLGGNDGLWRYDGDSFANYTKNFTGYIYEDRKGNIWTSSATSGNSHNWTIARYEEKTLDNSTSKPTIIKTEDTMFFGLVEDADGDIWFGSLKGVYKYNLFQFENFR